MGKRQVQSINVSTPLVLPSFDFSEGRGQQGRDTGRALQVCRCGSEKKTFLEPRGPDDPAQIRANMALEMVGQELNDQEKTKTAMLTKHYMHGIEQFAENGPPALSRTSLLVVVAYFRKILSDCSGIKQRPQFNARNCA